MKTFIYESVFLKTINVKPYNETILTTQIYNKL